MIGSLVVCSMLSSQRSFQLSDKVVSHHYTIKYLKVDDAERALTQVFPDFRIETTGSTFILEASYSDHRRVQELLTAIDRPSGTPSTRAVSLSHASATSVSARLNAIFDILSPPNGFKGVCGRSL